MVADLAHNRELPKREFVIAQLRDFGSAAAAELCGAYSIPDIALNPRVLQQVADRFAKGWHLLIGARTGKARDPQVSPEEALACLCLALYRQVGEQGSLFLTGRSPTERAISMAGVTHIVAAYAAFIHGRPVSTTSETAMGKLLPAMGRLRTWKYDTPPVNLVQAIAAMGAGGGKDKVRTARRKPPTPGKRGRQPQS